MTTSSRPPATPFDKRKKALMRMAEGGALLRRKLELQGDLDMRASRQAAHDVGSTMAKSGYSLQMIRRLLSPSLGHWVTTTCKIIFWPLAVLLIAALLVEFGAWTKEETHVGPFAPDTFVGAARAGHAVGFLLRGEPLLRCCLDTGGDFSGNELRSDLRLWINDQESGPPHTLHDTIRYGETTGFSHWGRYLIFALPPGVENSSATRVTVRYSLRALPGIIYFLLLSSALTGWCVYRRLLKEVVRRIHATHTRGLVGTSCAQAHWDIG